MTSTADTLARMRGRAQGIGTNQNAVKFSKQDYSSLKSRCLEQGILFEDELFPATHRSLGFNQLGPYSSKTRGVVWKRPKDLCSNPRFINDGATRTDICQGSLGDCWLLAAIASLTLNKRILARVIPPGQNFDNDYAGIFHFQFWQFGEWMDVVVDDRLPTRDGELLFVHSAEGSEFWSALLEKAYAKLYGSYEALSGGSATEGFEDFTGGISEIYSLDKAPRHLFTIIQKALRLGSLLGCSISITSSSDSEAVTAQKLVKGHAYSLTGAEEVHVLGRAQELVRLRNPWGQVEWTGAWSDGSREWNDVPADEKDKLRHAADDGEFWMSFTDFTRHFSQLEICNLTPDALDSEDVGHWNYYQFEGMWRVGSTAGGCRNNPVCARQSTYREFRDGGDWKLPPATFCSNPQFAIKLEDEDDDPLDEDGCTFLVGLMQKDSRREKNVGRDLKVIGFAIYKVPDEYKGRTNVHLGPEVLLRQRATARSSAFINSREQCDRFCLPPGEYIIVPSTFDPHESGRFLLRVFSEKQAAASNMEEDVNADIEEPEVSESDVDPHFKMLFRQIAGNDSEVSAFELIHVLNRVVTQRSDIKTDGFSLETGHHIVSLLDRDSSAKLGLVEFHRLWMKIQKYLEVFKRHDSDHSGTMSTHEMRGALSQAGFQVNSEVLQLLVGRYADAEYAIDFDSFVGCLIRLEMLFKMFKTLDGDDSGKIELNLSQWLCLAIN